MNREERIAKQAVKKLTAAYLPSCVAKILKAWKAFKDCYDEVQSRVENSVSPKELYAIANSIGQINNNAISCHTLALKAGQKAQVLDKKIDYKGYVIRHSPNGTGYEVLDTKHAWYVSFKTVEEAKRWIDNEVNSTKELTKNSSKILKKLGIEGLKYESLEQKRSIVFERQTHFLKDDKLALQILVKIAESDPQLSKWKVVVEHNQQYPDQAQYLRDVRSENEFTSYKGDCLSIRTSNGESLTWGVGYSF